MKSQYYVHLALPPNPDSASTNTGNQDRGEPKLDLYPEGAKSMAAPQSAFRTRNTKILDVSVLVEDWDRNRFDRFEFETDGQAKERGRSPQTG